MPDILPQHLELVHSILKKYLPSGTIIWVFGSRVKKAPKKYSDLDLLIDCEGKALSNLISIQLEEAFDDSDLPYKVDIVDWNSVSSSFKNYIQEKKILFRF